MGMTMGNIHYLSCFKSRAFSLIELMVVIAIVAILAAVAVPVYKEYRYKATINNAVVILSAFMDAYVEKVDKGDSLAVINGVDFTGDDEQNISLYPVNVISKYDGINVMCAHIQGLEGVSGYVAATNNTTLGTDNRICMRYAFDSNSGVYTFTCGSWSYPADPLDIDPSILPGGCDCASVSTGSC